MNTRLPNIKNGEEGSGLTTSETASGIELSAFDADFSAQVEAFRRTESRHRNSYKELAK